MVSDSEAFARHIVNRYYSLAEYTVFSPVSLAAPPNTLNGTVNPPESEACGAYASVVPDQVLQCILLII